MRTTEAITLTIPPTTVEVARSAAQREQRSLSNYTARLYELAGRIRLAELEQIAGPSTAATAEHFSTLERLGGTVRRP